MPLLTWRPLRLPCALQLPLAELLQLQQQATELRVVMPELAGLSAALERTKDWQVTRGLLWELPTKSAVWAAAWSRQLVLGCHSYGQRWPPEVAMLSTNRGSAAAVVNCCTVCSRECRR